MEHRKTKQNTAAAEDSFIARAVALGTDGGFQPAPYDLPRTKTQPDGPPPTIKRPRRRSA